MPVTRSQRYSNLTKTKFHKLVDGPVSSEQTDQLIGCKCKVLPTESRCVKYGSVPLDMELSDHYYDPNARETDVISSWDQISVVTEYTDNLTGKIVLRLYEGRYVRQKPSEYSREEYYDRYKKANADRLVWMEGGGRTVEWYCSINYFKSYIKDHFKFQDW